MTFYKNLILYYSNTIMLHYRLFIKIKIKSHGDGFTEIYDKKIP